MTTLTLDEHLDTVRALESGEFARLRRRAGMTQTIIARALGVHESTINRWEQHKVLPMPAMVGEVRDVLLKLRSMPAPPGRELVGQ